jgi:predicted homoserine dehydrogenase-like protein
LLDGGLVDYALGAAPHTGAFVIVHEPHRGKRELFAYGKLGDGPFFVFHTPFHLPHVQIASTIARASLQRDPTIVAGGVAVCETVTIAKRDLRAGEVLDGIGGYCAYGLVENADVARSADALPIGVSEGCRVVRDIKRDDVLTYLDVDVPPGRLVDTLRLEQQRLFAHDIDRGVFPSTGVKA